MKEKITMKLEKLVMD